MDTFPSTHVLSTDKSKQDAGGRGQAWGLAGTLLPWMCRAGTDSEDSHLGLSLDVASRDLHFRDSHGDCLWDGQGRCFQVLAELGRAAMNVGDEHGRCFQWMRFGGRNLFPYRQGRVVSCECR